MYYNFTEPIIPDGKDPYFYFNFKIRILQENIVLKIIDENKNETIIEIKESNKDNWISYKVSNLNSQNFTFLIINNVWWQTDKIVFYDGTKGLNMDLWSFVSFIFNIEIIGDNPPLPLEFNIETIEEETFYYFKGNNHYKIAEDSYLFEYCVINDNECIFTGFISLNFEKGKKYKIKQNPYKLDNNKYYFDSFSVITEIDSNITNHQSKNGIKNMYFLINIKQLNIFYIYVINKYNIAFMSEENKKEFPYIIDNLSFASQKSDSILNISQTYDYIILEFEDYYHTVILTFNNIIEINSDISLEIEKETCTLIKVRCDVIDAIQSFLISSNKNIAVIDSYINKQKITNILYLSGYKNQRYIYLNPSKEKSIIKYSTSENTCSGSTEYKFNLVCKDDLNYFLNKYGADSFYIRAIYPHSNYNYIINTIYFFDINENFYLYIKKFFGNVEIYQYNKELDSFTNITRFMAPIKSYEESNDYKVIDNELIILSGHQLFTFIINYNSLYDFYIQKSDDFEHIQINNNMFKFNNLVKLLNENKKYYLDFKVDHLIKLDNKFLDAEVIFYDGNGGEFILNKNNRIIKDLEGENITMISNKRALLYFYKKIPNYSGKGTVIFNKLEKGKNLKFNIRNKNNDDIDIYIVKDFGFEGYYPMINQKDWDGIKTVNNSMTTIYVENYFDKSNCEVYENEGENYIIYIFDSFNDDGNPIFNYQNYEIDNIIYFNNLLTLNNKYNFEIISANSNGSIILNLIDKQSIRYQFYTCKSKEIKFKIENSNRYFKSNEYPYEETINENKMISLDLNNNETLVHSFESDNEFLFVYSDDMKDNYRNNGNLQILFVYEISNNIIRIIIKRPYYYTLDKYFIIFAKKDKSNNIESFSDICYLAKLMIENSNLIFIKTFYEKTKDDLIITDIDISNLNPNENDEYIINIIVQSRFNEEILKFSEPKEFKLIKKEPLEIKPEETIKFNLETKNYFKFEYKNNSNISQNIIFNFDSNDDLYMILYSSENTQITENTRTETKKTKFTINKSGTYYLELLPKYSSINNNVEDTFSFLITGNDISTIDLSQKIHYKNLKFETIYKPNPIIYNVRNLKDDINVFFYYTVIDRKYDTFTNPFKICNDNNSECSKDIIIYKFLKDTNYTIYIDFVNEQRSYSSDITYYYPSYLFFPVFEDTVKIITNEGYYTFNEPKILIFNLENKDYLFIAFDSYKDAYISQSEENITSNDLINLDYETAYINYQQYYKTSGYKNRIIIPIITPNDNPAKLIVANKGLILRESGEYTIPSEKTIILYFNRYYYETSYLFENQINLSNEKSLKLNDTDDEEEDFPDYKNPLTYYNYIATFLSPIKNMKILANIEDKEKNDFIFQNYFAYPIYVEKYEKDINITIKKYEPRYAFFSFINSDLFDLYINKLLNNLALSNAIDFNEVNTIKTRLNSELNSYHEFFNFYFHNFEKNVYIYIKKYYGNTELCENNIDSFDLNDLSILT